MSTSYRLSTNERFPTTRWSVVNCARLGEGPDGREALDKLLRRYLPALRAHLITSRGMRPDAADEVLQSFCLEKVVEGAVLRHADAARGRFRTFLLSVLSNYLIDLHRRANAKFRSPGQELASLDHDIAAVADHGPGQEYELAWARQVIAAALESMREQCRDRPEVWGVFELRLLLPIFEEAPPAPYEQLVARFNFRSPSQAANALVTAKRMFVRALHAVIAEYADEADVDQEVDSLYRSLASKRA